MVPTLTHLNFGSSPVHLWRKKSVRIMSEKAQLFSFQWKQPRTISKYLVSHISLTSFDPQVVILAQQFVDNCTTCPKIPNIDPLQHY